MNGVCLIVGASSGLGKAFSYEADINGYELILVSSDKNDLEALAADIKIRYGKPVYTYQFDFISSSGSVENFVSQVTREHPRVNRVLIPLGAAYKDDLISSKQNVLRPTFDVNLFAPTIISKEILLRAGELELRTIVLVSSISSCFSRAENAFYSAAKAALEAIAKSLRIQGDCLTPTVNVIAIRLGYLESQYTFGRKLPFAVASPEKIAKQLFKRLDQWNGVVTLPRFWFFVLILIQNLPWAIYSRIGRVK